MRFRYFILSMVLFASLSSSAQQLFEVSRDKKNGEKVLKGFISRDVLLSDTAFKWYSDNLKGYTPNSTALKAFQQYKDSIEVLAFMGTWCEDSQFIIPKFYTLADASGFNIKHITLVGADREKNSISHLSEAMAITNVPTIIVMRNGKEMGRVVEYGKNGMWDKELGDIINAAFSH